MKKLFKKMRKDSTSLLASSLSIGAGSQVLGSIGGTTSTHGQQALSNLSGQMPLIGTVKGAGYALESVKGIDYKKKKKSKSQNCIS